MNPSLYSAHDGMRMMMQLAQVSAHMTAVQLEMASRFALMNPAVRAWQSVLAQRDQKPVSVTFNGLNTWMQNFPGMEEISRRFPDKVTVHFGANANAGSQALEGSTREHVHLHLSAAEPHRNFEATAGLLEMTTKDYPKPDYKITSAAIDGQSVPVNIEKVVDHDFVDLLHFNTGREGAPKVLLPAPMSGHYSTLIRGKIQNYLNGGFDVYVVDINNPRDIPLSKGTMDLNGLVDRYIDFIEHMGPGVHIDATCQSVTPTLIAASWLAKNRPELAPASLTLVAAPIDVEASPSEVTEFAKSLDINEFRGRVITKVPAWYKGADREVNPGFMQISSFMAMNLSMHAQSYGHIFNHLVVGAGADVRSNRDFYEEYLAWCDMDAPYNIQTIQEIFMENNLARGRYIYRGKHNDGRPERIDLTALRQTPILTMEGERDDISAPGQSIAAHDLIQPETGYHFEIPGVGHYGAFHGSKVSKSGHPLAFTFIHQIEKSHGRDPGQLLDTAGTPIEPLKLQPYHPSMRTAAVHKAEQAWAAKQGSADRTMPAILLEHPGFKQALEAA